MSDLDKLDSPDNRQGAVKKLLHSKMPFPPFKVIDLHEMQTDEQLRIRLKKNNPFKVIHDSNVKKQLYLLSEIFQRTNSVSPPPDA